MFNLNQLQEYIRRVHVLKGQGFFLQQVLIEYMKGNPVFDNLFVNEHLPNQDQELTQAQFENLRDKMPDLLEEVDFRINEREGRQELEMLMRGENKEEAKNRRVKEAMQNLEYGEKEIKRIFKRKGLDWK